MEDKNNISEEYRLLANQVYNDYIALGSLEGTAKKHKIPVSLAKGMIEDATGVSKPPPEQHKFSVPPKKLKEEFLKYGSLKALADHYGVSVKAVYRVLARYNLSAIKLHREATLNRIRNEYLEVVRKLGRHPNSPKEFDVVDGGRRLYNRIYFQYGSLENFRKVYKEP